MRDDFTNKTKEILAKRVGLLCSNPDCKKPTYGPNTDPNKATNIGVAAHITAASPNGPRYDTKLSSDERKNILNGIWLCHNCSILIDRDEDKYPVTLLNEWKNDTESELEKRIQGTTNPTVKEFFKKKEIKKIDLRMNEFSHSSLENLEVPTIHIEKSNYDIFTKQPPIKIYFENFEIDNSKEKKRNFERFFKSYLLKVIKANSLPIVINDNKDNETIVVSGWADDIDAEIKIDNYKSKINELEEIILDDSISRNVESESLWNLYVQDYSLKDLTFLVYTVCGNLILHSLPKMANFKVVLERKGLNHPVDIQHENLINGLKLMELSIKKIDEKKFSSQIHRNYEILAINYKKYADNSTWFQMESGKVYEGKKNGIHQVTLQIDTLPITKAYKKAIHYSWVKYLEDKKISSAFSYLGFGEEYLNKMISFKDVSFFEDRDIYCERLMSILALKNYEGQIFKDLIYFFRKFKFINENFIWEQKKESRIDYILKKIQNKIHGKPAYGHYKMIYEKTPYICEQNKNHPLRFNGNEIVFKNIFKQTIKKIRLNSITNYTESKLVELEVLIKPDQEIVINLKLEKSQVQRDIIFNSLMFEKSSSFSNPLITLN